ncbi:hypothetical protein [Treponema sp.]|uniref:hypothetical protein n=1 Tax=Treponema sp. TaxID=166 RepID=UPI0025FE6E8C|nr:hypothetical protein [Treponema sp.]MBR4322043.1 hypothetical protein [Treponema sp.]
MKKLKKLLGLITALFFIGGAVVSLASCSNDDEDTDGGKNNASSSTGNGSGPEANEATYSITFKDFDPKSGVFSVAPGETKTLEVDTVKGTWKIDEVNMPSEITVTKKSDGNFEIKGGNAETTENVSFKLYPDGVDENDTSYDVTIKVSVWDPYYTLNITLDDTVAETASKIFVYAEGKEDGVDCPEDKKQTVEATYTAGEKTATVKLEKNKSNAYKWFNQIVATVKNSNDEKIPVELTKNYFCYTATTGDGYLEALEITYSPDSRDFTILFEGFTLDANSSISEMKIATTYGSDAPDWDSDEAIKVTPKIASDGQSATFTIEKEKLTSKKEFYIDWSAVKIYSSGTTEVSISSGNTETKKWYSYGGKDWSNTLTHVSGEYVALVTEKAWSASSSSGFEKILEPTIFTNLNIGTLRVRIVITTNVENWANASSAETWATETYANTAWSDEANAKEVVITSSDFISALKTNGLYIATKEGNAGTVTVEYISAN